MPASSAPVTADAWGPRRARSTNACAPIASARPGMSLIGLRPVIQKMGDAASRSVAHTSKLQPPTPREENSDHAATMHRAPPIADQIASARASASTGVREDIRSTIGSEMCPSSM